METILVFLLGVVFGVLAGWGVARLRRRCRGRWAARHEAMEIAALAGGLAHEIRNPLSTLKVNLQLLGEDWREAMDRPDPDLPRRSLARLETVTDEAVRLDHTLEAFMRLVGRHELRLVRCDLNEILGGLIEFFEPEAQADGIQVRVALTDEPLVCMLDGELIRQALLNLLINARQAMPEGGELIVRSCRDVDRVARVDIADTGHGMDRAVVERIWQPYYSSKKGGSGLGLPTTRRIVQEHHGSIDVASQPGRGTNFAIHLPLATS